MRNIVVIFLCFAVFLNVQSAYAQTKIGVVDVIYLMSQSNAAKSIQKQRAELQSTFLDEINKTEKKLRNEEQALIKEREKISQEDFIAKKQEYEKKLLETGRQVREKKKSLEVMLGKAMNELQKRITKITADVAKRKEIQLVINNQNVLIGTEDLDLTKEILELLNKEVSTIKLDKP